MTKGATAVSKEGGLRLCFRAKAITLRRLKTPPKLSERVFLRDADGAARQWSPKAYVETLSAHWVPGKAESRVRLLASEKRYLEKHVSWFLPWIRGLQVKRERKGQVYDASSFTAEHERFKDDVLQILKTFLVGDQRGFEDALRRNRWRRDRLRVAYLDAPDRTGSLRVTSFLKKLGLDAETQLFSANFDGAVVADLRRAGVRHAAHTSFASAMEQEPSWSKARFHAVYLDLCGSSIAAAKESVEAIASRLWPDAVLAVTLSKRSPFGGDFMTSWAELDPQLARLNLQPISASLGESVVFFRPSGICTRFYRAGP